MSATLFTAAPQFAAVLHRGRHPHLGALVIVVVIAVVVAIILLQRRRDHRPVHEGTPAALHGGAPGSVGPDGATVTMSALALDEKRPAGHYSVIDLARAEWTKLRSVRSTMWTLAITVVLGLGVSAIATAETRAHWSTMSPGSIQGFDPTSLSLIGVFIGQFAIGVLGVLVMSAEYSTGTIRAVLAAAPHRRRVLAAKVLVFAVLAVVVAEVVSFASFFLGQALLGAPAIHATLASPGALRAVVGSGLYVATLGVLGLGLATIIRHSAGAISAFVGILLILPLVVQALPSSLADDVRRFLPDRIGASILTTNGGFSGTNTFSPWVGLALLVGYAVVTLVVGAGLLQQRDA